MATDIVCQKTAAVPGYQLLVLSWRFQRALKAANWKRLTDNWRLCSCPGNAFRVLRSAVVNCVQHEFHTV